jgi:hypothetical protein
MVSVVRKTGTRESASDEEKQPLATKQKGVRRRTATARQGCRGACMFIPHEAFPCQWPERRAAGPADDSEDSIRSPKVDHWGF